MASKIIHEVEEDGWEFIVRDEETIELRNSSGWLLQPHKERTVTIKYTDHAQDFGADLVHPGTGLTVHIDAPTVADGVRAHISQRLHFYVSEANRHLREIEQVGRGDCENAKAPISDL